MRQAVTWVYVSDRSITLQEQQGERRRCAEGDKRRRAEGTIWIGFQVGFLYWPTRKQDFPFCFPFPFHVDFDFDILRNWIRAGRALENFNSGTSWDGRPPLKIQSTSPFFIRNSQLSKVQPSLRGSRSRKFELSPSSVKSFEPEPALLFKLKRAQDVPRAFSLYPFEAAL